MIVPKSRSKYTSKIRLVIGRGFVDTLSSIFNSIKPALQNVSSFIRDNKDLIAKTVLGVARQLVTTAINKGIPSTISSIMRRKGRNKNYRLQF